MKWWDQWPWFLGGGLAVGFVALLITRRDPLGVGLTSPPGPVGPRPEDPPGAPLRLFTDDRYRACISVPFGLGWAVSMAKIIDGATKMGFREVSAVEDRPPNWNDSSGCDYFVEGVWSQPDKLVDRHSAIKGAWRRTRA